MFRSIVKTKLCLAIQCNCSDNQPVCLFYHFYAVVFHISFAGGYTVVYFLCNFLTGAADTQRRPHFLG
nr:MAG TPA: hypothetical protein [Bacteriophage sp.]